MREYRYVPLPPLFPLRSFTPQVNPLIHLHAHVSPPPQLHCRTFLKTRGGGRSVYRPRPEIEILTPRWIKLFDFLN